MTSPTGPPAFKAKPVLINESIFVLDVNEAGGVNDSFSVWAVESRSTISV
jgi:hypothetical protein